ncbi:hypothetical protein CQW23_25818 [Capsicum baccatum]|uniref:Ubiquitin-like protease family profile domain-containing protein n=1 Tax=Capsicum baccatum TaxID=33114 RepID=A0A2G2VM18_CAPBA|nr:hypothetical protein CQW23_25818 [Capsicum baccatum]
MANREEETPKENLNDKHSETVVEDHGQTNKGNAGLSTDTLMHGEGQFCTEEQIRTPPKTHVLNTDAPRDELVWLDSQNTIPDEFLPSLNVYQRKSIIVHSSANLKNQTPKQNIRIRSVMEVYSVDDPNLITGGQEFHLNEYINGFRMHAAVPWYTVDNIFIPVNIRDKHHWVLVVLSFFERCILLYDSYQSSSHYAVVLAEIDKLVEIIPLCLQACNFYEKKGINLHNHPRYKDKDSTDLFDVLFDEDLPQQSSWSLNGVLYMVTYAECLSYGKRFSSIEFNPNTLRTRYAELLWDYGMRKQEAKAHSDVEAPLKPDKQSRITSVTEVLEI